GLLLKIIKNLARQRSTGFMVDNPEKRPLDPSWFGYIVVKSEGGQAVGIRYGSAFVSGFETFTALLPGSQAIPVHR
ncbi:MAG: hypothetical protein V2B13_13870, partial [Pseudomonadota bacterium]